MPFGQSYDPSAPVESIPPPAGKTNDDFWIVPPEDDQEELGTLKPTYGLNNVDQAEADKIADDPRFNTALSPEETQRYQAWKQENAPNDSGYDYDLKGAFQSGLAKDPATGHWNDRFKKPNHPTFSDQSQYAKLAPQYAGMWDGDKYLPASERMMRTGDIDINPPPLYDQPVVRGDGKVEAPTYLGRARDRFLESSYYNVPLGIAKGAANVSEMVGSLLEAYGDPVIMRTIGEQARAAGIDVNQQIDKAMDPAWKKSMERSWADASSESALVDPKSWAMGVASQLPLVAASIVGSEAAAGKLALAGLDAFKSRALGYGAVSAAGAAGDAASGAGAAADAAGLSPEQRRRAERIAGYIGGPVGALTGPLLGRIVHGETGGLVGSLAAGAVEEGVEETGTAIGQETGKAAVGLPFDWAAVREQGVAGAAMGGALGAGAGKLHSAVVKRQATDKLNADAAQATIKAEADRISGERQAEADQRQAAEDHQFDLTLKRMDEAEGWAEAPQSSAETAPIPGAQRPGPPPYGPSPAGAQPDFVAGMDPSLDPMRAQNHRSRIGEAMVDLGDAMDKAQQAAGKETDKAKRGKLVGDFRAMSKQMASLQAQWAQLGQEQGFETQGAPATPPEELPTSQPPREPDLDATRAYAATVDSLHSLQQQIGQTRDPSLREGLVAQFRDLNQQAMQLHEQLTSPGAPAPAAEGPTPEAAGPASGALPAPDQPAGLLAAPALRLAAPTAEDVGLGPDVTPTKKGNFAAGTTPGAVMTEPSQAAAREAPSRQALQVLELEDRLAKLQQQLGLEPAGADTKVRPGSEAAVPGPKGKRPTPAARAKLIGEVREVTKQYREASRLLNDAVSTRDRLTGAAPQLQGGLPGLPQTGGGPITVDFDQLGAQLDAKFRPVGEDAIPAAQLPGMSPLQAAASTITVEPPPPPPLHAAVLNAIKRSQAAKAGAATKAAARQQASQDAAQLTEPQAGEAYDPSVVRSDPGAPEPTLPAPPPLEEFPADTKAVAHVGAELQAIRNRFPAEPQVEAPAPVSATPEVGPPAPVSGALEGPPAAEAGSGGTTLAPGGAPSGRGSNGQQSVGASTQETLPPVMPELAPSKVEKTVRAAPISQPEFVDLAAGMNQANQEASLQNGVLEPDLRLPDPSNPAFKIPEAQDQPLSVPQAAAAMNGEPTSRTATATRNVLGRLLADGPKTLGVTLQHLQANLEMDRNHVTARVIQKLAGMFPATTRKPSALMVEKRTLSHGFQGLYDPRSDTITIDLDQALDPLQALLHEAVHAATIVRARTNPDFKRRLQRLALEAKKHWQDNGWRPDPDTMRAFTNHEEFVSHALTDSSFQDRLAGLYPQDGRLSMWQTVKQRLLGGMGYAQASPERSLVDQLLEFIPDGDFLQEADNRAQVLAELDRLGLNEVNAMMSQMTAMLRPATPQPTTGLVAPVGRVRDFLISVYTGDMIVASYGKYGRSFYNHVTKQIEKLSGVVDSYGRLIDQKTGYAVKEQAKGARVVDVFKNAIAEAKDAGQLGEVMEMARMFELDPSEVSGHLNNVVGMTKPGSARAYAQVKAEWDKLAPAEQDAYLLVRDLGEAVRYNHINNMMVHRMRAMVDDEAANRLSAYINDAGARPPNVSPNGKRHNVPISYAPVMTKAQIDEQVTRLMPADRYSDKQRKNVSVALKEVYSLIKTAAGPYFPLRRYGNYFVALKSEPQSRAMTRGELDAMVAQDRETGLGTLMIDGRVQDLGGDRVLVNWHHEQVTAHDNEDQARVAHAATEAAWTEAAKVDGRKVKSSSYLLKRDNAYEALGLKSNSIDSLRRDLVKSLGGDERGGDGIGQMASDVVLDWFLDKLPSTSVRHSSQKARLVKGASTDMLRAFADYVRSNAFTQAQMTYGGQINQLLTSDLRADVEKMQQGRAFTQAVDLEKLGNSFKQRQASFMSLSSQGRDAGAIGKLWQRLPNFAAAWLLTGHATALINLMQVPQTSLPYLGARYGWAASAAALKQAYMDISPAIGGEAVAELGRAAKNLPKAIQAVRKGQSTPSIRNPRLSMIDQIANRLGADPSEAQLIHDLAGSAQADYGQVADLQSIGSAEGRAYTAASYLSEAAFVVGQAAETLNRVTTGLAQFRLERAKLRLTGKPLLPGVYDQLVVRTVQSVKDTQFNYGRENKAPLMQHENLRAAAVFKNYMFHQLYTIGHNFMQSLHAETQEERVTARKFLAGYTAMTMLAAGAAGFTSTEVGYLVGLALMQAFGSDAEDPEEALRRAMREMPKWLTDATTRGVPYAAGIDTSQRMGIGSVVPLQEIVRTFKDPSAGASDWFAQLGMAYMGAPGSIGADMLNGLGHFLQGDVHQGMEKLTPKMFGAQDMIKAWNYAHYGVQDTKGSTILEPESFTASELIAKAAGFNPSRVAEVQAKRSVEAQRNKGLAFDRQEIISAYAKAALSGGDVGDAIDRAVAFSRLHPGDRITKATLLGAIKHRQQRQVQVEQFGVPLRSKAERLRAFQADELYNSMQH